MVTGPSVKANMSKSGKLSVAGVKMRKGEASIAGLVDLDLDLDLSCFGFGLLLLLSMLLQATTVN